MTAVASEILKYYRNFFSQLKIYVTTPMSCTSKFSSYVIMISDFFIVINNESFTNRASVTWSKFFFFTLDQFFIEVFFHYSFRVFKFFKNRFNKFVSSVFTSENNYWFGKFIINTNKLVSKTTKNVILIFFYVEPFINFNSV